MTEKYGFIYIWRDKKHKRYYIGCHWGYEDDKYICSSNWMRDAYNRRKDDFKRRIIKKIYTSKKDMFLEEQKYLDMIKDSELGKRYYNLNKTWKHWIADEAFELSVREKISKTLKENFEKGKLIPHNKGKKLSKEHKKKISDAHKNKKKGAHSFETRQKISDAHKGKKLSEEHKSKLSAKKIGKKLSAEHIQKCSESLKGRKFSEEHKKRISDGVKKSYEIKFEKGIKYKHTEESKRKISETNKRRFER